MQSWKNGRSTSSTGKTTGTGEKAWCNRFFPALILGPSFFSPGFSSAPISINHSLNQSSLFLTKVHSKNVIEQLLFKQEAQLMLTTGSTRL